MSALTALAIGAAMTLTAIGSAAAADDIRVRDGDTIVVAGQAWRLSGIQAPERGQALYKEAGQAVREVVSGAQEVTCVQRGREVSYDRKVGFCRADGLDIALELLRDGLVCTWRRYHPLPEYVAIEQEAKQRGVGMWGLPGTQRNRVCR